MIDRFIFLPLKRASLLRLTLINMGLLDELLTGFFVVGLPLVRDQLGLSYEQVGLVFSAGALSAMILEPVLNLLSDQNSKRWWILGGLLALACGTVLAGSTHNFILLLVAFAIIYPANGAAVGLSQAALIDSAPNESTRIMTRWTLMSSIGDLLSPVVVTTTLSIGLGWPGLCWIAAGFWLATALVIWPQHFPNSIDLPDEENGIPIVSALVGLRQGLRDPILLRWIVLSVLPTMLDEIFLTFAILYLRDVLHASQIVTGLTIGAQMVAACLGLLLIDRLLKRIAPVRLLTYGALLTLIGIVGLLSVRTIWFAPIALFAIGLGATGLYPIAQAEAYARWPGRSGTVLAIVGLGEPFEVALPGIVGLLADHFGVLAALGLLGLAPLLILLLVPRRR